MKTKPLLFYPIHTGIDKSNFIPYPPCYQLDEKYFARRIVVEISKASFANEQIWKKLHKLGVDDDERASLMREYAYKRLLLPKESVRLSRLSIYPDSRYVRLCIAYPSAEKAREAVQRYHRTKEYPDVCASTAEDILSSIREVESIVMNSRINAEQDQIVYVYLSNFLPQDLETFLVPLSFLSSSCFGIHAMGTKEGIREAVIRFPSLSQAFIAELLTDGSPLKNDIVHVRMARNPVLVHHDLKVRASLVGDPFESLLINNFISQSEVNVLPRVGCSNINCSACGNTNVKIKI